MTIRLRGLLLALPLVWLIVSPHPGLSAPLDVNPGPRVLGSQSSALAGIRAAANGGNPLSLVPEPARIAVQTESYMYSLCIGESVAGRVTDAVSHNPLPGVRVSAVPTDRWAVGLASTLTNGAGEYTLPCLSGHYSIVANKESYLAALQTVSRGSRPQDYCQETSCVSTPPLVVDFSLPRDYCSTWYSRYPMPTERAAACAVQVGLQVFVLGGVNDAGESAANEAFDAVGGTWSTRAEMQLPRAGFAAGLLGGKIYVAGGTCNGVAVEMTARYDPTTNTWAPLGSVPDMPHAGWGAAGVVLKGKLWVAGGNGLQYPYISDWLRAYDPGTNAWTMHASMNVPRSLHAMAALNGKLFAIGGNHSSNGSFLYDLPSVEVYDPNTDRWTAGPDLPQPLRDVAAVADAANNRIVVVGGTTGEGDYGANEIAHQVALQLRPAATPSGYAWTYLNGYPTSGAGVALAMANGELHGFGGRTASPPSYNPFTWALTRPACNPDLSISGVELTQGVRGTGAFVADRPLVARVAVETGGPSQVRGVRGTLEAIQGGVVRERVSTGPFMAKTAYTLEEIRSGADRMNFRVSPHAGAFTFRVTLNSVAGETNTSNNTYNINTPTTFQETRGLHSGARNLRLCVITRGGLGLNDRPTRDDAVDAIMGITRLFPVSEPGVQIASYREYLVDLPTRLSISELYLLAWDVEMELDLHNKMFPNDRWDNAMLLLSGSIFPSGLGGKVWAPTTVLSIMSTPGWRQARAPHELAHTYGIGHDLECPDPPQPRPSPPPVETGAFDPFKITPADVMSATDPSPRIHYMFGCGESDASVWTKRGTYESLFRSLGGTLANVTSGSLSEQLGHGEGERFAIGSVRTVTGVAANVELGVLAIGVVVAGGHVELLPAVQIDGGLDPTIFPGGPYALEAVLAGNTVTLGHFDMPESDGVGGFHCYVPGLANVQRLRVLRDGMEVATREASAAAPSVAVVAPNGGELLSGVSEIRWVGSDADQDSLMYTVLYSPDDGGTWEALGTHVQGNSLNWNFDVLPGAPAARLKVIASDGLLSAEDVSNGPFSVSLKPPVVVMNSTASNDTIVSGDPGSLSATAWDPEDGTIPETSICWTSSIDGDLSCGSVLPLGTLSAGQHHLRVSVTDANANVVELIRDVTVVDDVPPLVQVLVPNGGETWGANQVVRWSVDDNVAVRFVNVEYSLHGPNGPWLAIANELAGTDSLVWWGVGASSDSALMRVEAVDVSGNRSTDLSDDFFRITATVSSPQVLVAPVLFLNPVPNPSTDGKVVLEFGLPSAGPLRLEIFTVGGRKVWSLSRSGLRAGNYREIWDGRDSRGQQFGAGVYFARLESASGSRTVRFVIIR